MARNSEQWIKGDKVVHPQSGEGVVEDVYYWESKDKSGLTVSWNNGYCSTGTDQATHEQNGWCRAK